MPTATSPAPAKTTKAKPEKKSGPETKKDDKKVNPETKREDKKAKPETKKEDKKDNSETKKEVKKSTAEGKKEVKKVSSETKKEVKKENSDAKKENKPEKKQSDRKQITNNTEADEEIEEIPVYVPKLPVSLPVLNTLEWASCAKVLENLLNFTPALGASLSHFRPYKNTQHIVDLLNSTIDSLPSLYLEIFLKRFNELALIPKSKLTKEQKCCVGLDKLTEEQLNELKPLYTEFRDKFGFPFIVCARNAKVTDLAAVLRTHLPNSKDQELRSGREELKKIARLRLLEVVAA